MQTFEYKVIPAPQRGEKDRGLKTGAEKFAHALGLAMNELAREGWEYWRAETLPAEERAGLTSKTTVYHNLLVFRRPVGVQAAPENAGAMAAVDAMEAAAKRLISAIAPEGRAPRLGPADEPLIAARPVAAVPPAAPAAAAPGLTAAPGPAPALATADSTAAPSKADLIRAELGRAEAARAPLRPVQLDPKP